MNARRPVVAASLTVVAIVGVVVLLARPSRDVVPCGPGFTRAGPRCCPTPSSARSSSGECALEGVSSCPPPLVITDHGCDAPEHDVVEVPATTVTIGPSDWEAEGRVAPRTVKVAAFSIDRLEVTAGRACASVALGRAPFCQKRDPARAAFGVSLWEARTFCKERGGRLPTEDEWLAAAAGDRPRRYPWGDTGAVCRRAAWGLASGPCAEGANGPDTVGAHPDGATPLGIHDLAGNVAEWVETGSCREGPNRHDLEGGACIAIVRGGSWSSTLATELRTWLRREVSLAGVTDRSATPSQTTGGDPTIGFRCAYDKVP